MLKSEDRIAGYVIYVAPGLSSRDYDRAVELGPSEVGATDGPARLHEAAGFVEVQQIDVTPAFLETTAALIAARERHEGALRLAEGDEEYEAEQTKKRGLVEGTTTGLLRRALVVASKP